MKQNEGLLNKKVSLGSIGAVVGGTILMSFVAGALWHMGSIKRLIQLRRM